MKQLLSTRASYFRGVYTKTIGGFSDWVSVNRNIAEVSASIKTLSFPDATRLHGHLVLKSTDFQSCGTSSAKTLQRNGFGSCAV